MRALVVLALVPMGIALARAGAANGPMRGVPNPARASQNWMLKCQGCHRSDGSGTPATAPGMIGTVSTLLGAPGGRGYIVRVPGVATVSLPDDQLAELLNWTLQRFDPAHLPPDFLPYAPEEVETLRRQPLRTEAAGLRREIIAYVRSQSIEPGRTGQERY